MKDIVLEIQDREKEKEVEVLKKWRWRVLYGAVGSFDK